MIQAMLAERPALDTKKFQNPEITAKGEARAAVALAGLRTLWINTGSLCNIECDGCYIESGPKNDPLAYITRNEAAAFLDEIARDGLGTQEIGFTGGEPFMNKDMAAMAGDALARGFRVLILTNAMAPLWQKQAAVADLARRHGKALALRVSIDHFTPAGHEAVRGANSWAPMMRGLKWLAGLDVTLSVAACSPPRASTWTPIHPAIWLSSPTWTRPVTCRKSPLPAGASWVLTRQASCAPPPAWW